MRTKLTDVEMDAWQALLHSHHQIIAKLDTELRSEHGLSMGEYDVLLRLARAPEGALKMSDIAARILMSASGLTRMVDGLERRGYVERARSTTDARVVLASLTPLGRERLRAAAETHLRGIREHFTGRLTEQQLKDLASALQVITGPHQPH